MPLATLASLPGRPSKEGASPNINHRPAGVGSHARSPRDQWAETSPNPGVGPFIRAVPQDQPAASHGKSLAAQQEYVCVPGPAIHFTMAASPGRRRDQRDFDGSSARSLIGGGF